MNLCKDKNGVHVDVRVCVKSLSLEERKWKRILGECVTIHLEDRDKKITKLRIYAGHTYVYNLFTFYVITHMFERTGSIANFLDFLRERNVDYEILERDMEQDTIQEK